MTTTAPETHRDYRNTAQVHERFGDTKEVIVRGDRVDATLTLEDGRQIQVGILNNGRVLLRAWAAEPYATNNADACSVSFNLPTLEDMVLDGAQVSELNMRTSAMSKRSLATPEEHDGTWYYATQAIRDRVEGIKTLLALRRGPKNDGN